MAGLMPKANGLRAAAGREINGAQSQRRVRASWQRSARYGVSPEDVTPAYTGELDSESLFFRRGEQVLRELHATISTEPVSLMLADRDGLVLIRLCTDSAIRQSLDRVHLAPGFSYAERFAGTNGLGLSLADRAPTLVRAEQHFCATLRGYTCAAAPVFDPRTGELAGSVNLTTWSDSSSDLLLALAQAAAGATSALMHVGASGRQFPVAPRGRVVHVVGDRDTAQAADPCVSSVWRDAVDAAAAALAAGRVMAVVGEAGAGKTTLAAHAVRRSGERRRVLHARAPAVQDSAAWLALWTPELAADDTCVIVSDPAALPAWAAGDLLDALAAARRPPGRPQPFVLTAPALTDLPAELSALVDAVVEAAPLRERVADVLPLADYFATTARRRRIEFTDRAARALTSYPWPGNVRQLRCSVADAAARTDTVDARHLPAEVFTGGRAHLSRLEVLERDAIIRALHEPGVTVGQAAEQLGIGRATMYRKIAQYEIVLPSR